MSDVVTAAVKALNERREQLKLGLVTANAKKRQSLVRKTDKTDKLKSALGDLKIYND